MRQPHRAEIAQLASEQTAVESVINLLLKQQFQNEYQITVVEKDDKRQLQIHAEAAQLQAIQQLIMNNLVEPGALRQALHYQVGNQQSSQNSNPRDIDHDVIPDHPTDDFATGMKMLTSLFPHEIGAGFVFRPADIFDEKKGAHHKNGVLFSCEAKKPREKQMWEFSVENMLEFFDNVPIEEIRNALETQQPLTFNDDESDDEQQQKIAKGLLLECFGTVDNRETGAKRLYFNFFKLFQLLYPPKLKMENESLVVDLEHLTMFMKQAVREGFLLSTDGQPIFYEARSTITKPLNLLFNLDMSGSMSGNERAYRRNIEDVLGELRQHLPAAQLPTAKVSFQLFSDNVTAARQYNLTDVNNISRFLSELRCSGGTALYRAIHDGFDYVSTATAKNNIIVLFTDGDNTTHQDWGRRMVERAESVSNNSSLNLTVFTLGLGNVKEQVLRDIANQTGTTYFPVARVDELKSRLLDNIDRLTFEHRIVSLLVNSQTFKVPVPKNGSFSQAQVNIPMQAGKPVNLTVDGENYVVTLREPSQQNQLSEAGAAGLHAAVNARHGNSTRSGSNLSNSNTQPELDDASAASTLGSGF